MPKTRLYRVLFGSAVLATLLFFGWELYGKFPNAEILKSQWPVVKYMGPKAEPDLILHKKKPSSWVSLSAVSRPAWGAILVSEDWAFFDHPGYDLGQIQKVLSDSFRKGKVTRGASTLTQQVAKNVFLSREKTMIRKLRELFLAVEMERVLGKKKILEIYLNIAEWGEGIFGISAASRHYFGKSPEALNAKEGAFLAMLLPSPKKYSVSARRGELTPYARRTMSSILRKMEAAGFIEKESVYFWMDTQRLSFEKRWLPPTKGVSDENLPMDEGADDETVEGR